MVYRWGRWVRVALLDVIVGFSRRWSRWSGANQFIDAVASVLTFPTVV